MGSSKGTHPIFTLSLLSPKDIFAPCHSFYGERLGKGQERRKEGSEERNGTTRRNRRLCQETLVGLRGFFYHGTQEPMRREKGRAMRAKCSAIPFSTNSASYEKHCLWRQVSSATGNVQIFLTAIMGRIGFGPFTDSSQKTPARLRLRHPRLRRRLG